MCPMQILRTNGSGPPTGLAEGQLSVEMDTKNLWVGVPTSIDASGRVQLNAGGAFLPLAGGTLDPVTAADNNVNRLLVQNTGGTGASAGITATNASASYAVYVSNTGAGRGINLSNGGSGIGLDIDNWGTSAAIGLSVIGRVGTAIGISLLNAGVTGLSITGNVSTGDASTWLISADNVFRVRGDGPVILGTPTGPTVTGPGNVNVAGGYYVNGVAMGPGLNLANTSTGGGFNALAANAAIANTAYGYQALQSNTTGVGNTAIGHNTLLWANGDSNTAVGVNAFGFSGNVSNSIAIGNNAMYAAVASSSVAIGVSALGYSGLATNVVAIGTGAVNAAATMRSVAIGGDAGRYYPGVSPTEMTAVTDCIYIGYLASALADNADNEIVIGSQATGNGSNTVTLGNASSTALYLGSTPVLTALGGTLTPAVDTGGGVGITITNQKTDWSSGAIHVINDGDNGVQIENNSGNNYGSGLWIVNNSGDSGISVETPAANGPSGISSAALGVNVTAYSATLSAVGARGFSVSTNGLNTGACIDVNNIGTGTSLLIRNGATTHVAIAADGSITLSAQAIATLKTALGI